MYIVQRPGKLARDKFTKARFSRLVGTKNVASASTVYAQRNDNTKT